MRREKAIFNWSGGKDSAFCLYQLLNEDWVDILCLLTTVSEPFQRITMHGVRVELLNAQAQSIGLPLVKMQLPDMPTMENYNRTMTATLTQLKIQGATASVFGDIFLEDLRKYREELLAPLNLKGIFPLWKTPSKNLIHNFIDLGFKAIVTCVNEKFLDHSFAGRMIDHHFLKDLPSSVDPCGEHGEFHTFVFDGPIFKNAIAFEKGEIVHRTYARSGNVENSTHRHHSSTLKGDPFEPGFWYCDLLP